MSHSTITDVRDLDCVYLATIAGDDYYELRQIARQSGGVRAVVGRASDWPIIQAKAQIRELTALLTASERRSVEADCHVAELLARLSAYEELFALTPAAPTPTPTTPRDDGKIPCDHPDCLDWIKPRGMAAHKRQAHGISIIGTVKSTPTKTETGGRKKCPYCKERPKAIGLQAHIERRHPEHIPVVAAPAPVPIALALGEAAWRCDACHESTHARSLKEPALCIRCVAAQADAALTNGHQVAA